MKIEIPIYDGFDDLDAFGPHELISSIGRVAEGWDATLVHLDGAERVVSAHGTVVIPAGRLSQRPEMVIVPGGGWHNDGSEPGARAEYISGELPDALARLHADGVPLASVCTGALLLAKSGMLAGRPATTHHAGIEDLRAAGAEIVDARVVDDGDILTAGGVTSGFDLALWLVERDLGAEAAARLARWVEYEPTGTVWRREQAAAQPPQ